MHHTKTITLLALWTLTGCAASLSAQGITWLNSCADRNFCLNQNSCAQGNVLMVAEASTTCGSPNINFSYRIDLFNNGSTDIMVSNDSVMGNFATGTHKMSWKATDNCGNVNNCTFLFTIADCQPPTLVCLNGLTQQIEQPGCAETFLAKTFIINLSDNCTPTNQIKVGIRKAGTTGFPTDTSMSFGSCDFGINFVEILVKDANGLVNQCNSYVLVQDADADCVCNEDADITVKACVRSPNNRKIPNYVLKASVKSLTGITPPVNKSKQKVSIDSCATLVLDKLPFGADYQVTVRGDNNFDPLFGVSTLDLVALSKHILNIEPLTTAYQALAADANRSNSITTFDIVELRKLILGVYDTLPMNPAWRLIKPIATPSNILAFQSVQDTFLRTFSNVTDDLTISGLDIVAVKIGDLNFSATPLQAGDVDDRGAALYLRGQHLSLRQGETVDLPVGPEHRTMLQGWQLGLRFDPTQVEVLDVTGLPEGHVNMASDGRLQLLDYHATPKQYDAETPFFYVKIRALRDLDSDWSAVLSVDTERIEAEAYTASERHALRPSAAAPARSSCSSPRPNPTAEATRFDLSLATAGQLRMTVFDAAGRACYEASSALEAGAHQVELPRSAFPSAGLYYYRIQVSGDVWGGKLVVSQ
jgi:hypothetical protein